MTKGTKIMIFRLFSDFFFVWQRWFAKSVSGQNWRKRTKNHDFSSFLRFFFVFLFFLQRWFAKSVRGQKRTKNHDFASFLIFFFFIFNFFFFAEVVREECDGVRKGPKIMILRLFPDFFFLDFSVFFFFATRPYNKTSPS